MDITVRVSSNKKVGGVHVAAWGDRVYLNTGRSVSVPLASLDELIDAMIDTRDRYNAAVAKLSESEGPDV